MLSKLLCVALFATALTWARPSSAQHALVESYDAPPACPDAAWFESEVVRRLAGVAPVAGALRVSIRVQDDKLVGAIERVGAESDLGAREVTHESCEQVTQALALIGALWLAPEKAPESPAPAPAPIAAPETPMPAAAPKPVKFNEIRHDSPAPRLFHGPALGIAAQSRVAPGVRFGPRLAYRIVRERPRYDAELVLSWTHLGSGTITVQQSADAELTYDAGTLRWCESLALVDRLRLGPCLAFDLGVLRGTGTVSGTSVTRSALWASGALLAKLEARLTKLLFVEAVAGALYPFAQPSFHFAAPGSDPSERAIYKVKGKFGFSGDLLLGLLFR